MRFAKFIPSGVGRGLRSVGGTGGVILAVVGAMPLLAGILELYLFTPLFSRPLKCAAARIQAT